MQLCNVPICELEETGRTNNKTKARSNKYVIYGIRQLFLQVSSIEY